MWRGTVVLECDGERWCGMWWITLTWNMVENFDVEYGGERWCEIWCGTLTWNAPENGYVR